MKRLIFFLSCPILIALVFSSCGSTPPAQPEVVEPVQQAEDESGKASSAEEEARRAQLAADMERLLGELSAARDAAVAAGADRVFPQEFGKMASDYDSILKLHQDNPSQDQRIEMEAVRDAFLSLERLAQAQVMRERIIAEGVQDADAEAFGKGEASFAEAQELNAGGAAGTLVLEKAQLAHDAFAQVLAANFKILCERQRELAFEAKDKADSIKSEAAAREDYGVAALSLSDADLAYANKDYEGAYTEFLESTDLFLSVYDVVYAKRAAAEEAIRRAKQKVEATAIIAAEADLIAPLQAAEEGEEEGAIQ